MRKNERRGRKVCADSKLGRALETRLGSGQLGSFVQLWEVEEEKAIVHPGARGAKLPELEQKTADREKRNG